MEFFILLIIVGTGFAGYDITGLYAFLQERSGC
jgi:hypothetical protein